MATHPQILLQASIYSILSGDATLIALLAGGAASVLDVGAKDNVTKPYVTIGDINLNDWGSHTHDGFDGEFTINVWTESPGRKSAQTILNRIFTLLHNADLSLSGFPTLVCRCAENEVLTDDDMRSRRGVQRYRIKLGGN